MNYNLVPKIFLLQCNFRVSGLFHSQSIFISLASDYYFIWLLLLGPVQNSLPFIILATCLFELCAMLCFDVVGGWIGFAGMWGRLPCCWRSVKRAKLISI